MRSIRRTSIGYLLVLLVLALGGVSLLIDRFANAAVRAREESETQRIEQTYLLRRQEAQGKFDAELRAEARSLAREVRQGMFTLMSQGRSGPGRASDEDAQDYRVRASLLAISAPSAPVLGAGIAQESRHSTWVGFVVPRVLARLQDGLRKTYEDEAHPGYFQVQIVLNESGRADRTVATARPNRLPIELSFDAEQLGRDPQFEQQFDDIDVPEKGQFRRVVVQADRPILVWMNPSPIQPPFRPGSFTFPPAPGTSPPNPTGASRPTTGPSPVRRTPDMTMRVYVHMARPESDLIARLERDQQTADEQLTNVRNETRAELTQLRTRLAFIGGFTFIALLAGGWVVIGHGLAPVGKLSVAVSQVSEKDFHLPHDGKDLPAELAPIHARINQTLDLLRRAFAREKQSVADISHELRTPIASLMAIFDVTLRKQRTPEQYRTALEDCRGITKQLGQLVERIMTLASLDAGTARTVSVRTDASEVAHGCAAVIRPLADSHSLSFDIDAPEQVELDTDPDKLREVLINLLHNAIEYNQPGGHVRLAVRQEDDKVLFEVRDTGIGMASDVKDRIFERFYRADASRHATGVHAGLGLSIVKEYVERLNGTISVESEEGVGTTFRVLLPAAKLVAESELATVESVS